MPPKRARTTGGPSRKSNQWKDEPNIVKQIQFTADPGLKINMESKKPLYFFRLFVTEELINIMVVETNRYATQEINKQRTVPHSYGKTAKTLKSVFLNGFQLFLALNILKFNQ